jgi:hypothetical protein
MLEPGLYAGSMISFQPAEWCVSLPDPWMTDENRGTRWVCFGMGSFGYRSRRRWGAWFPELPQATEGLQGSRAELTEFIRNKKAEMHQLTEMQFGFLWVIMRGRAAPREARQIQARSGSALGGAEKEKSRARQKRKGKSNEEDPCPRACRLK